MVGRIKLRRKPSSRDRLNINIDARLKAWMEKFAEKQGVTLTQLVHAQWDFIRSNAGVNVLMLPLDRRLREWAEEHVKKRHTTVEQLLIDLLVQHRERQRGTGVEQV